MTRLLGADVGGSHHSVAIARSDLTILARAEGPGIVMRAGRGVEAAGVIAEVARRAAAQSGGALPVDLAVIGAAGAGREPEQRELARELEGRGVARSVTVRGDGEIALVAAFGISSPGGIFVNAGTGSIAYARDPGGTLHRSGGYGWQLGDVGGGYWLGRRTLEIAGQAHDGQVQGSALLARVLGALGLPEFDGLVRWAAAASPAQVAGLAPHLLQAARDADPLAQRLVAEAAAALVALVGVLAPRFPAGEPVAVATGGGLLAPGSPLADAFRVELARVVPRARLTGSRVDPVVGALRLAAAGA